MLGMDKCVYLRFFHNEKIIMGVCDESIHHCSGL